MKTQKDRGIALVALAFIILVLGVVAYSFVGMISQEKVVTIKPKESSQALFVAEAGIQLAIKTARVWLHDEITVPDGYYYLYEDHTLPPGTVDIAKKEWDSVNAVGLFEIVGYHGDSTRSIEVKLYPGEEGYEVLGCPPGVFGDQLTHLQNNAYVDSYDSRVAPWVDEGVGRNGTVASNVLVTLDNNATVYGDAFTFEPDGEVIITEQSTITGTTSYLDPEVDSWELEPITIPLGLDYTQQGDPKIDGDAGKGEDYEIQDSDVPTDGVGDHFILNNNGEVTFNTGTYRFKYFECSNNAILNVAGPCDVYIELSLTFENNSELLPPITFTGDTTNLKIYFLGTETVDISNNVVFYGYIYAPDAKIEVNNNDSVYGALVADEVYIWNNAAVHFDEALMDEYVLFIGSRPAAPLYTQYWMETFASPTPVP